MIYWSFLWPNMFRPSGPDHVLARTATFPRKADSFSLFDFLCRRRWFDNLCLNRVCPKFLFHNLSRSRRLILSLLLPLLRKIRLSNGSFPPQSLPHRASPDASRENKQSLEISYERWNFPGCTTSAVTGPHPARSRDDVRRPTSMRYHYSWKLDNSYVNTLSA